MHYDRRRFIKKSGVLGSGLLLGSLAAKALGKDPGEWLNPGTAHLKKYGLQFWGVRDVLAKDPKGTLAQIAPMGYTQIESFEGDQGMFWGMSNTAFKQYVDGLGLDLISSHCAISNKDGAFEKKAADAAQIGMKYLICPYYGKQKTLDDYKTAADQFNQCGAICKKQGIRFAYHNHWYSFQIQDGVYPQEIFMTHTDPTLVDYEMDIYWVVTAGADPLVWLKKYPGRFRLGHVKDRLKNADPKDFDASCDLGTGSIDFPGILKTGAKNGMDYFIVEQEKFTGSTLDAARVDARYMGNLNI